MSFLGEIINFFEKRSWLSFFLIFIISASLFGYLASDQTFVDPDSFYHAKMAQLLWEKGAITSFPWLSATTLQYKFADHHFLYHLALIPFVKIFPAPWGLKIATVLFASFAILAIYWFLRQLKISGSFWYVLFLLTINPFVFRLNLAKAQGLVIFFLFIILSLIFRRAYLTLILGITLYVWLYGGWPILFLIFGVYLLLNFIWPLISGQRLIPARKVKKIFWQDLNLVFSLTIGIVLGLVFSPYFPFNLGFYWEQSFKIAIVNYQHLINVGGEWYPYLWSDLILAALSFFLLLALATAFFILTYRRQNLGSWFFFILTLVFFALTLKSRRYVEYFIPFGLVFAALSLPELWRQLKNKLRPHFSLKLIWFSPLLLLILLSPIFYQDLKEVKTAYQNGFAFDQFLPAARWLAENSLVGDIVFHSDWDEFPLLFFHNDLNYYLVGLDPTFMYNNKPNLYRDWSKVTTGEETENLYPIIKNIFGARYVFVDARDHYGLIRNLENNINFEEVFSDNESRIFQVR